LAVNLLDQDGCIDCGLRMALQKQ